MSFLGRIFGGRRDRVRLEPLYRAIVNVARARHWYAEGRVPDTVDGRFDMIAAILALVLIRLEGRGTEARDSAVLTELFIADMDASLRQIGIGDMVVGKHVLKLMGALGGRIAALRAGPDGEIALHEAVRRNIFHDSPPSDAAVDHVAQGLRAFNAALTAMPPERILAGALSQS